MIGIGCMSGTSLDGLDMACVAFTPQGAGYAWQVLAAETVPFDERWHSRLYNLPTQSAETYAKTNVYFGHWLGRTVKDFIAKHGLSPDFVASHGQTIFHQPDKNFTAQIGDGETMATYLPCRVVTNFRNKDVALGGQGAPLVPFGEMYLFPAHSLFLNLGGFANLTLSEGSAHDATYHDNAYTAFDVVPCNIVLNQLVREGFEGLSFDPDGQLAASGGVNGGLLYRLNGLPYFAQHPPKSLGWEWVQAHVLPLLTEDDSLSIPDILATYCEHVAIQVAVAASRGKQSHSNILLTGGGWHNAYLRARIAAHLAPAGISVAGVTSEIVDYKEAIIFAFLGLRVLEGLPNVLPSVTGAREAAIGGSIHW